MKEVKGKLTEQNLSNLEEIKNIKPIDISSEGLSKRINKVVDEDFTSIPTSDKFITTQTNSRGMISYPLLLIENIEEQSSLDIIKNRLSILTKGDTKIKVMYKKSNKAVFLCDTTNSADVAEVLLDYCIEYKYFISKGNIIDIDFKKNFDFSSLNIIENTDSFIPYKDTLKDPELEEGLAKKMKEANDFLEKIVSVTIGAETDEDEKEKLFKDIGLSPSLDKGFPSLPTFSTQTDTETPTLPAPTLEDSTPETLVTSEQSNNPAEKPDILTDKIKGFNI